MKQAALISLICLYALSSLGIGVKQFYCCGKLQSSTIAFILELKQKCTNADQKEGCCNTKFANIQVRDSHLSVHIGVCPGKPFAQDHFFTSFYEVIVFECMPQPVADATHATPPGDHLPIYLLQRNFRI